MVLRIILIAVSWLLLAAHFSRADINILALICLLAPFLLLVKKKWALKTLLILTSALPLSKKFRSRPAVSAPSSARRVQVL